MASVYLPHAFVHQDDLDYGLRNVIDTIASWMCGQPIDYMGDSFLVVRVKFHAAFRQIETTRGSATCSARSAYMSSDEQRYVRCQMTRQTK